MKGFITEELELLLGVFIFITTIFQIVLIVWAIIRAGFFKTIKRILLLTLFLIFFAWAVEKDSNGDFPILFILITQLLYIIVPAILIKEAPPTVKNVEVREIRKIIEIREVREDEEPKRKKSVEEN